MPTGDARISSIFGVEKLNVMIMSKPSTAFNGSEVMTERGSVLEESLTSSAVEKT